MERPKPLSEVVVWTGAPGIIMIQVFTQDALSILDEARLLGRVYEEAGIHYVHVHKVYDPDEVFNYLVHFAESYKTTKSDDRSA